MINLLRGRIAALQRWPDGLQAAVEAKEGIETTETGEVLDTITVQALINRHPTVCGMTGTALAAGEQLRQFYKLGVSPIPPNTPNVRETRPTSLHHRGRQERRIIDHIHRGARHRSADPGRHPRRRRIRRTARNGCCGAGCPRWCSTPRTTRRRPGSSRGGQARRGDGLHPDGRAGTDIRPRLRRRRPVRRPPEVAELGGLHVVGTGRHRTERLDNQLRVAPWLPGRPRVVGVLLQLGGRRGGRSPRHPAKLPTECDETGRIVSPKAAALLGPRQRVAEGRLLTCTPNTWRYNQLIAQQRAIIVERRNTLLSTATARDELEERSPERYRELADKVSDDELERICRDIMLFHLDRGWADHLAYLSDIRESIHLRALGRQNPLDEFHRMAVDAFGNLAADAIEAAQQTFETANVLTDEQGLDLSKLARPTSTWTYMVHDNPLNDDTMSALSLPGYSVRFMPGSDQNPRAQAAQSAR